jgi:long-chain acyl-CoA synthetase
LKDEYQGKVDASEIREHCKKFLSPYEVPAFIDFREEMPLTVSEKVFKKVLRDEAIEKIKKSREGS